MRHYQVWVGVVHLGLRLRYGFIIALSVLAISMMHIPPVFCQSEAFPSQGPYVDRLVYNIIEGDDQQILALQNDEIDLIGEDISPYSLGTLQESENIEIASSLRNGYGYVVINTAKYPFNITAFRRALAFAIDKEAISRDVWNGHSVPLDSCIPQINPFSIEGQLSYNYYENDSVYGNQLLDQAGFFDIDEDGFREAPDGSDFSVALACVPSSSPAITSCNYFLDAFDYLGISSEFSMVWEYPTWLYMHGDYDMAFLESSFMSLDVDWLAYEFWSESRDEPYRNLANFCNATYDSWRDQLLQSMEYDDVHEAALEMQEILAYECPVIVCYENEQHYAYRTDRFEGYVNDVSRGIPSWWTNFGAHLKDSEDSPHGGTFRWSNPLDLDTFNFMATSSAYTMNVLQMLHDPLLRVAPDGTLTPWLAIDYEIDVNPGSLPESYSRYVFQMATTATWSDGTALTAADVAFSFNYYREAPGNPHGKALEEMTSAYAQDADTVVVEFSTESYWHLHRVGNMPIIPKHVFENVGVENWYSWNPEPTAETMITSGPFVVAEYESGEFVELSRRREYFRALDFQEPYVSSPASLEIEYGTKGHVLRWNVSGALPISYWIFSNETILDSGSVEGGYVQASIDDLGLGVYNYTLKLRDRYDIEATDTVWVRVYEDSSGRSFLGIVWPLHPLSLLATLIFVGVAILYGGKILRVRQRASIAFKGRDGSP
ncbi:hypothetical protein EU538_02760 [Candidatus Thorarchaeota archaeon]|nr:MAG: hypothetical protein EU538_02760 [Candidatus Thorarchaeota archaeon]